MYSKKSQRILCVLELFRKHVDQDFPLPNLSLPVAMSLNISKSSSASSVGGDWCNHDAELNGALITAYTHIGLTDSIQVIITSRVRPPNGGRNAVAMKQTLGRQVGEVREHECNMHVCVGVG